MQLVIEAALLAAISGALGLLVAQGFLKGLLAISPENLPRVAEIGIDWRAALFTFGIAIAASLLFGLAPAIQVSRAEPGDALKSGDRAASTGGRRLRAALVLAEVALSTFLLATAALLTRSFYQVTSVDPGFRSAQVLTIRLSLPRARYKDRAAIENFFQQVHPRIAALPGVTSVAASNVVPMNNYLATTAVFIDGVIVKDPPEAHYRMVSPDYFRTLGMTLLAGRSFTPGDRTDAQPVAIVNHTLARQFWGGVSPIGSQIRLGDGEKTARLVEVIGVVGDVKHFGFERPAALEVYVPMSQVPEATTVWLANNMYWVVDTGGAPLATAHAVRREIAAVDPSVPASFVRSMDQWVAASVATRRFNLQLVLAFALITMLLAVVGVYAVSAAIAAQRTREIGIRAALGASRGQIVSLMLSRSLRPVVFGVFLGTAGVLLSAPATTFLLFGVAPHDPLSLGVVAVVLTTTAVIASYVPARRASNVDPLIAFRTE
jgi:putative ABC transport system permease protein